MNRLAQPIPMSPSASSVKNAAALSAVASDSSDVTEAALIALAQDALTRKPEAIRAFLQAIVPSVRRVCRAVMGSGHADLEDAIQESLMGILRALPKYRFEGKIVHYANRIALRVAISTRTRGKNRDQHLRTLAAADAAAIASGRQSTITHNLFFLELLAELSTVQAEAIVMHAVLGYSVEEAAAATQVSMNTTKSRLRAAKERLRKKLTADVRLTELGFEGALEAGPSGAQRGRESFRR